MEVRLPCAEVRLPCMQRKMCGCGTCGCAWVCASCVCTSVLVRACERVRARLWVRAYARTRVCALCARVRACCVWEVCERAEADRLARGPWPPKGHPPDVSVVGTANSSRRYAVRMFVRGGFRSDHLCSRIAVIMYQMRSGADSDDCVCVRRPSVSSDGPRVPHHAALGLHPVARSPPSSGCSRPTHRSPGRRADGHHLRRSWFGREGEGAG